MSKVNDFQCQIARPKNVPAETTTYIRTQVQKCPFDPSAQKISCPERSLKNTKPWLQMVKGQRNPK